MDQHTAIPPPNTHWAALNPLPSIKENPFHWKVSPATFKPREASNAKQVATGVVEFYDKLVKHFLMSPGFTPEPSDPWYDLPPFPFPSVSRLMPPATRHPFPDKQVVSPNYDKAHKDYHENGARMPLDYARYTDDSELLYATWPNCFEAKGGRDQPTMDVSDFLALYHQHDGNASYQAELIHPRSLNQLALSLNVHKFPFDQYPPPDVDSIALVITTIDSQGFRDTLPAFVRTMRRILAIHDSTVFINMETVGAETLSLLVKHVDFARVFFYFTPIPECVQYKPYHNDHINKDWKINVSLLFIMHVVYNVWGYDYLVVVEDDMEPSRDVYLFHLAVSAFANQSPDVFTVGGSNTGRWYDCYHMAYQLSGNFTHQPDIANAVPCEDDGQTFSQDDLLAFNLTSSHLLTMERVIVPWACGYTRKYYAFLLNFFLTWTGTLGWQRYDISAHRIFAAHPYMRALVPANSRVYGDPVFSHGARKLMPLMTACQHTEWRVVAPAKYKTEFSNSRMKYYDWVY